MDFIEAGDDLVVVAEQRVLDHDGRPLAPRTPVFHRYTFEDDLVRRMVAFSDLEAAARRAMILARQGWQTAFVDGIGFTLISLFDGFLVVTALDLGAPGWLIAAAGVAGVIVGRRAIHRARTL